MTATGQLFNPGPPLPSHPARYTPALLPIIERWLPRDGVVLDMFAGTGRIHRLATGRRRTIGVELEPEWANLHPDTIVGNALELPFPPATFDAAATSPCLAQEHRVLTADLRWVAAGEITTGDMVLAFDEHGRGVQTSGTVSRRRWRRAEVVRSVPRSAECVRVVLANGDEIITTPEHPWLSQRYSYSSRRAGWVPSSRLVDFPWVHRQAEPWRERRSFDAGWLSGMFDGEGALSLGVHGCPKLVIYQAAGPVLEHVERLMAEFGYEPNLIWRKDTPEHRKQVGNLYVTGGFPAIMRALGELRPLRLLDKWAALDLSTRTIEAEKIEVLAVEPCGRRDIQEIETSEGTYFGEGYLHHNCYGNRMADTWAAAHKYEHRTYSGDLGRKLHPDNAGQFQWGPKYRAFHESAWEEARRVLKPGGRFIVNIKDHVRAGRVVPVANWHVDALTSLGFRLVHEERVETPGLRYRANHDANVGHELVLVFDRPAPTMTHEEGE